MWTLFKGKNGQKAYKELRCVDVPLSANVIA
jgi:hypothetical protein